MSDGVTRSEDKDIKAALFQFISETEVKLYFYCHTDYPSQFPRSLRFVSTRMYTAHKFSLEFYTLCSTFCFITVSSYIVGKSHKQAFSRER